MIGVVWVLTSERWPYMRKYFLRLHCKKMLLREVHILGRALYSLRNFAIPIANH